MKNPLPDRPSERPLAAPTRGEQLRELRTPLDVIAGLAALRGYRRWPRGREQPVMVLPGYGGGDGSTWLLRQALTRANYRAVGWRQGRNKGDVPALLAQLEPRVLALAHADGPVHLVGWSLGGYIARELARDLPHAVAGVVTLGSPVVGGPKYTVVARYWQDRADSLDAIEAAVEQRYAEPIRCPVVSIYSRRDGVVHWRASIDKRSPRMRHIEIASSHLALGFSARVIRVVLQSVAENVAAAERGDGG